MPSTDELAGGDNRYAIRAVDRTCDILDILAAANGSVSLTDIAAACGLPKTSVFRYVSTLEARRYVERVGADYRLGVAFVAFQVDHIERLANLARPTLEALRDRFGETTNLGLLVGREVAYLEIVESHHSARLAARKHDRDAVHCTALGKAIIAALPDPAIYQLIGVRYPRHTANTVIGWPALKRELAQVREQGYAVDDEENEVGGRCVAVRIPGELGGAVSVSGVSARLSMDQVPDVAVHLQQAAAEIARHL